MERALGTGQANLMNEVFASTLLGSPEFIESIKSRWVDMERVDMRNVPSLKYMVRRPSLAQIQEVVRKVIEEGGRQYRRLCFYISQQYGGYSLKEIGSFYGMKEAAVSQANRRFKQTVAGDERLRRAVEKIATMLRMLNVET